MAQERKPEDILEEPETLESPIRAHLDAEGAYARAILGPNRALERRLVAEMRGRLSPRDQSVPEPWGPWEYFTRYPVGSQRKLHCRRPRDGGPEQVLLDENVLARGRRAFSLSEVAVSPDHKLLAYSVDEDGSERNHAQGPRSRDRARPRRQHCRGARHRRVVARQPMAVLCRRDPVKWGQKVFRHRLGTPVSEDQLVYEEAEEGFSVSLRVTLSDRFLVIETADFSTTDLRVLDLAHPTGSPQAIAERKRGYKYWATNVGDRLIVLTNADGATDWKIGEKLAFGAGERRRCGRSCPIAPDA